MWKWAQWLWSGEVDRVLVALEEGTEKFWSEGAEALTKLAGDYLSDTPSLERFWHDRPHQQTGTRDPLPYASAA